MTATTYDGQLTLEVQGARWKRTRRPPLELTVLERPSGLLALPTDQSGGTRGGDRLRTEVIATDHARVDWVPPASSLYYPSRDRQGICTVSTHLVVGASSRLHYRPKVSIPCSQAHVEQSTLLEVDQSSDFFFWDGWTDGRTAAGERRAFANITNELELRINHKTLFRERWSFTGERFASPGPDSTPDPAGFQGACQWFLGFAVGEAGRQALLEVIALWKSRGQNAELGALDDGVWIGRALSCRPLG